MEVVHISGVGRKREGRATGTHEEPARARACVPVDN